MDHMEDIFMLCQPCKNEFFFLSERKKKESSKTKEEL